MTESRIGIIGGLSWESTASYYRYFNELFLGFGVVLDDDLQWAQHGHGARDLFVKNFALEVL